MKKIYLLLISIILSFGLYAQTPATKPTQGDGSELTPYKIENLEHLRWLSENDDDWDMHFIQTADIDATETASWNEGAGFSPIGNNSEKFKGSYNGDYHKIENLTINRSETLYIGLFGYADAATIKNIILENINIIGKENVGGLVGYLDKESSKISQASVTGSIFGWSNIGSICGNLQKGVIEESFSDATLQATYTTNTNVGGIVGFVGTATIINNYSLANIESADYTTRAGGVIGYNQNETSVVQNNYFAGTITGNSNSIGGIISFVGTAPSVDSGNFWDIDVTNATTSKGNAEGISTNDMIDPDTFIEAGWIFKLTNSVNYDIWNHNSIINNGYPYLVWQNSAEPELNIDALAVVNAVSAKMTSSTDAEVVISFEYIGNPATDDFGVCYGLTENTDINDNTENILDVAAYQEFVVPLSGLTLNQILYVRAFATNSKGTVYGEPIPLATVYETQPAGDGTEANPYKISTFNELLWISNNNISWSSHFEQTDDIDAILSKELNNGEGFSPIGVGSSNSFRGVYDGGYHKIENLTINRPNKNYQGLFGHTNKATIKNLKLENVDIRGKEYVGGMVGFMQNNSAVSQTTVTGSIVGYDKVGGICGNLASGIIEKSITDATLQNTNISESQIGGIVGYVGTATLKNNYSLSDIISTNTNIRAGGIIGYNQNGTTIIQNNYFAGIISANSSFIGGVIGAVGTAPTTDSGNFWDIDLSNVASSKGNAEGKSTADMQKVDTFVDAGWEFAGLGGDNIWDIDDDGIVNDGYPYLVWTQDIDDTGVYIERKAKISEVIAIYPNPFNDVVNITGEGINSVKIYTMSGIQVLDVKFSNESDVTIPTSEFDKGIYLFVIENGKNLETHKLIKK